ncbi:hypothetical protein SCUP234_02111 [Seiridium cupressi]
MHARSIVASVFLLAAAVSVGSPRNIPISLDAPLDSGRYPGCPEDYDAYCCTNVIPYSNRNFASVLRWTGDSFDAILRPTQYKTFLKAGMPEPWVPLESEIHWEGDDHNRDKHDSPIDDPEPGELRRDVVFVEEEEMV